MPALSPAGTPEEITTQNIHQVMENVWTQYSSQEKVRWQESNSDMRCYAGDPDFLQSYLNIPTHESYASFVMNIVRQPCDMVTGYQRQHRKSVGAAPVESSDEKTAEQFTSILKAHNNHHHNLEAFSKSCEQTVHAGMNIMQPYLDFSSDPINGDIKIKVWEYNSFLIDPYFRNQDGSDASFCWFQQYMTRSEAMMQFQEEAERIESLPSYGGSQGRFYFLPENYQMNRADMMVVSYFWFKKFKRKKKLLNKVTGETVDLADENAEITDFLTVFDQFEVLEVNGPSWQLATLVNDVCVYFGDNPLGDFNMAPFVPNFWNYDPQIADPALRDRSLVRALRDLNFLYNRKILNINDQSEARINSGWMYFENSIVNEEALSQGGNGYNIQIKSDEGYTQPSQALEKITNSGIPQSDIELANQLFSLRDSLSGVNQELLGAAQDDIAGITHMLRQGAGLVTLQKYFDQWDMALKLIGKLQILLIQYNWAPYKIERILGEQPSQQFFSKAFTQYDAVVVQAMNTPTQRNEQLAQISQLQQQFGLQFPAEFILEATDLTGKENLTEMMQQQQQEQQKLQQQQQQLEQAKMQVEMERTQADTQEKIAMARERVSRTQSNIGLYDERQSEVQHNRSKALKEKVDALKDLLDTMEAHSPDEKAKALSYLNDIQEGQYEASQLDDKDAERAAYGPLYDATGQPISRQNPIGNLEEGEGMQPEEGAPPQQIKELLS